MDKWVIVASISTAFAAFIALIAVIIDNKNNRFTYALDHLLKFESRFNSDEMINKRKLAAQSLKNKNFNNVDDILNYFELLGYLVKRKALNKYMVWQVFYYWLNNYYLLCKDYIDRQYKKDPTIWEHIKFLYDKLKKIENRKNICYKDEIIDEKLLSEFIEMELKLI